MYLHSFALYTIACIALVAAPGPDNILAMARGLSQGRLAACVSAISSGCGILVHVAAATLGLTALLLASNLAFMAVKLVGAAYLIGLGIKAIRSHALIAFNRLDPIPLSRVFTTGFLSASLNPKVGIFILAFVPQFIEPGGDSTTLQMALLGTWFALLTVAGFALMGVSAGLVARFLAARPYVVAGLNSGAGIAFIASGLSVAFAKTRSA